MAAADETAPEALAGEFVLGTLDALERQRALDLIARDAAFGAAVRGWEARLGVLTLALADVEPPGHMRARVLARIAGEAPGGGNVVRLKRQVALWRGAAGLSGALAAALAGIIVLTPPAPRIEGKYVAVLAPEGHGPAFLAAVDLASGYVSIRRLAAEPQVGRSYELWAVGGGRAKPQSLGVIEASSKIPVERLAATGQEPLADTVLAVSLEPEGGSPTGQPTGPVLFTGKLVATE